MPPKDYKGEAKSSWVPIDLELIKEIGEGPDKIETSNMPDRFAYVSLSK